MDDPWGSPWIDETPHQVPPVDTTGTRQSLTPEQPLSLHQALSSPWGDGVGFEDWTALPKVDSLNIRPRSRQNDPEPQEWNTEVINGNINVKQKEDRTQQTWFTQTRPHIDSKFQEQLLSDRNDSQDPWAEAEPVQHEERTEGTDNRAAYPDLVLTTLPNEIDPTEMMIGAQRVEEDTLGNIKNIDAVTYEVNKVSVEDEKQDSPVGSLSSIPKEVATLVEQGHKAGPSVTEVAVCEDSAVSRPSSSPSNHSHRDDVLLDSPRTSFEDEPRQPKLERHGSSKVKELVQLFEGRASVGGESGSASPKHDEDEKPDISSEAADDDDFGDFEEGSSDVSRGDSYQMEQPNSPTGPQDHPITAQSLDSVHLANLPRIKDDDPMETLGSIAFDVDLSLIDQMFISDSLQPAVNNNNPSATFDAEKVQDSFSTIGERKVWYRISRYGTMRKHNTGDEDYVRINWSNSSVRAKTLKLVAKWIEGDRVGGLVLGGDSRPRSLFGWGDKNGAPLTLESAFAARKGRRISSRSRSRKSSLHNSFTGFEASIKAKTEIRRDSVSPVSQRNIIVATASPAAAHFGWSTSQPTSTTAKALSLEKPSSFNASMVSLELPAQAPLPAKNDVQLDAPQNSIPEYTNSGLRSSSVVLPKAIDVPMKNDIMDTHENEDWGDMVSSPASFDMSLPSHTTVGDNPFPMHLMGPSMSSNAITPRVHVLPLRSLSGKIETQPPEIESLDTTSNKEEHQKAHIGDVWASADFSFFDTPNVQQQVRPDSTSVPITATPKLQKQAQYRASRPIMAPTTHQPSPKELGRDEETIVRDIVQNLPDLSYILRR